MIFERLFGDGGNSEQRMARIKSAGSLLDSVLEETSHLSSQLGRDNSKLHEYLDSIREVEQRIQSAEAQVAESIELPDRPIGIPSTFEEHCRLMFDLQVMAFRADITRVFTLVMARELSGRSYASIGVPGNHHLISHHRNDAQLMAQKAKIDTHHVRMLSYFLEKMQSTPDGDGSLLDHSLIMFGSGMGDGNLHRHSDLPCLLAGKLSGKFQTGYHLAYKEDTHGEPAGDDSRQRRHSHRKARRQHRQAAPGLPEACISGQRPDTLTISSLPASLPSSCAVF